LYCKCSGFLKLADIRLVFQHVFAEYQNIRDGRVSDGRLSSRGKQELWRGWVKRTEMADKDYFQLNFKIFETNQLLTNSCAVMVVMLEISFL
jgi:hypothetical protein